MARSYDHLFKVLLIGDQGVGKANLIYSISQETSSGNPPVGVDFCVLTFTLDGQIVKLQAWDTAGQDNFKTISSSYFRGAAGVLVVYDVTNAGSFASLPKWLEYIEQQCGNISRILVGTNDDDDQDKKVVYTKDAEKFAASVQLQLFETNVSKKKNIKEVFIAMARLMLNAKKAKLQQKDVQKC